MSRQPTSAPMPRRARRRIRGQAMTEVALLTTLLIGAGASLVYFYPDSLNSLQIYMDSFYFVLSMPIP